MTKKTIMYFAGLGFGLLMFAALMALAGGCTADLPVQVQNETETKAGHLEGHFYDGLFSAYYADFWGQQKIVHRVNPRIILPASIDGAVGQSEHVWAGAGGLNDPWYNAMFETGITFTRVDNPSWPGQTITKYSPWVRCSPGSRYPISLTKQMPFSAGDVVELDTSLVSHAAGAAIMHGRIHNVTKGWTAERDLNCPAGSDYWGLSAELVVEREWDGVMANFHSFDTQYMKALTYDINGQFAWTSLGNRFDMYNGSGQLLVRTDYFGADNQTGKFIWVQGQ